MNVGYIGALNQLGEYEKASLIARMSWPLLAASKVDGDWQRLAGLANNLGVAYEHVGRYEEALELYAKKIDLWQGCRDLPRSRIEVARTHINVGVLKKRLNLHLEAQQSFELGRKMLADFAPTGSYRLDLARVEMHLAHLQVCRNAPHDRIAKTFAQARAILADTPTLLKLDLLEAEWRLECSDTPVDFLSQIVVLREYCQERRLPREVIAVDLLLARYYANQGELARAISICLSASKSASHINDWESVYRVRHTLGRMYMRANDLKKAARSFQQAVSTVEKVRKRIVDRDLRCGFFDDKLAVYGDLVALHLKQDNLEQAFYWVEQARARELMEVLGHHDCQARATTSLPELCGALSQNTLLLVFTALEKNLWVLPLTSTGCLPPQFLGPLPVAARVEQHLNWIHNVSKYPQELIERHADTLIATACRPLTGWYEQFLAPLSELLEKYDQLIIVPDGPLFLLPFHAFYNAQAGRYLAETHEISYAPSATILLANRKERRQTTNGVAFAYAGQQLNYTTTEMQAITAAYPDFAVYEGEKATTCRLRSDQASQASVVHFAAHAVFRADNPLYSFIELRDGRIEALDILQLTLQARLVVLSACQTGLGMLRGGDYFGLVQAFLLAGAQAVMATHWAVDDAATAGFMGNFYQELAKGVRPSLALQRAQTTAIATLLPQERHPYYWAPFFLLETVLP
jgi:CHAT domain-containing protein